MSKSVLVVDDEPDQRWLMRSILEAFGYQVVTASNGQEALQVLATSELPGPILLDITMPVMSGREFLAAVHSGTYPELEKIPIVVISAIVDRAQLQCYSCAGFLSKPANIESILSYAQNFAAP